MLVVDDDRAMRDLLVRALGSKGYAVSTAGSATEALSALDAATFEAVVTDVRMKGLDGIALCRRIVTHQPDVPVIVITGFADVDVATQAIRAGAYDFVAKPFEMADLEVAIARAIEHGALRSAVTRLREPRPAAAVDEIVGESAAMKRLSALVARIADNDVAVLVRGEPGSGKELVARALHRRSRRADGPFVAVDCSTLSEHVLESDLLGHAIAGAHPARPSPFQQASGGTLFLDEVGALSPAAQAMLARILEERAVRPGGGESDRPVDVRVIAATSRDLDAMVASGAFREELQYLLDVVSIDVPPLRHRGRDILLLAQRYVIEAARRQGKATIGISALAAEALLGYAWPGNVRELASAMERAVAMTRFDLVTLDDVPERIRSERAHGELPPDEADELASMEDVERRYIARILHEVSGNEKRAAEILGFDRKRLARKLEKYGLSKGRREGEPRG